MNQRNRRTVLVEVGQGMLVALIGPSLAGEMGLASRALADDAKAANGDALEPLIHLMQDTPKDRLFPLLKGELDRGTSLRTLVAAGAVANARAFAGQDYDG